MRGRFASCLTVAFAAILARSLDAQEQQAVYFEPTGTACTGKASAEAVTKVEIKADEYVAGMISPDSAKAIALCWVPGQISSGEMNSDGTRTVYAITVLPTDKKTYSKVIVDAKTGAVLSTKQFGGARGLTGFLRESAERKKNKDKPPQD